MARVRTPRFKQCRRLGLNVCGHPKAMKRYNGRQARDARELSPGGKQLLEKQRLKAYYEVLETQFRRYVKEAMKNKEKTGVALVNRLECRLDNLVYRLNLGSTLRQSRQMVVHGHILVNGKKVDRPSYKVEVGDQISLKEKSQSIQMYRDNFLSNGDIAVPYLKKDETTFSGTLVRLPQREEIPIDIKDQLIIEYYTKVI